LLSHNSPICCMDHNSAYRSGALFLQVDQQEGANGYRELGKVYG
jgi:hypothetical protein